MKGKIFLITTIILFISLGVAGYFLFDFSSQIEELTSAKRRLEKKLDNAEEELETAEENEKELEEEIGTLNLNFIILAKENYDQEQEITRLMDEVLNLTEDFDELSDSYDFLSEFTYCSEESTKYADISYESNNTVSASLIIWYEQTFPTRDVTGALWFEFWEDFGEISYHKIESTGPSGPYLDYYIVFFDDPDNDHIAGVFSLWWQCWLDIQE